MLMEKYRESQKDLHFVFVDQRKHVIGSGQVRTSIDVREVQDMYEGSETVLRCAVKDGFRVEWDYTRDQF